MHIRAPRQVGWLCGPALAAFYHLLSFTSPMLLAVCCLFLLSGPSEAVVTTFGSVTPIPPAEGGSVQSLTIGTPETQSAPFGIVTVDGATQLESGTAMIGTRPGYLGTLNVTQPGSRFISSNPLSVGMGGVGDLNITDGGSVVAGGLLLGRQIGIGVVNVSGEGSLLVNQFGPMLVSRLGSRLIVSEGGRLVSTNSDAEVSGLMRVQGDGSILQNLNGGLFLSGGELQISDGGQVLISEFTLISSVNSFPAGAIGRVTVSGPNSLWSVQGSVQLIDGYIRVENEGQAIVGQQLDVEQAGSVYLDGGTIITSRVENRGLISGGGRIAVREGLSLINQESGIIQIGHGESLTIHGGFQNSGSISVQGGVLDIASIQPRGRTENGNIAVENGEVRFRSGFNGSRGGGLTFLGGANRVFGQVTNVDTLLTGDSRTVFHNDLSGAINVTAGSTLTVLGELQFLGDESHLNASESVTPVTVSEFAHLQGSLAVSLVDDTEVAHGDRFTLVAAMQGITGQFQQVTFPQTQDVMWQLDYQQNSLDLVAGIPGDYSGNGVVDAADYTVWRDSVATQSLQADGNNDGRVNAEDYLTWRTNFGQSIVALAESRSVPEPSGLVLAMLSLCVVVRRRLP